MKKNTNTPPHSALRDETESQRKIETFHELSTVPVHTATNAGQRLGTSRVFLVIMATLHCFFFAALLTVFVAAALILCLNDPF